MPETALTVRQRPHPLPGSTIQAQLKAATYVILMNLIGLKIHSKMLLGHHL
jgi:hypothetical protein